MKICSKCKEEKELSEFYKYKPSKDGLRARCKKCMCEDSEKYYKNNKEKIKEYYSNNEEKIKEKRKEYYENNKENLINKRKEYYENNKEKVKKYFKEYRKEYYENNKELIKEKYRDYRNNYYKNRRKNDPLFRLTQYTRRSIKYYLESKGYKKNTKTENILGCSFEEFKKHIESQFEDWMNWDNQGLYNGEFNYGWDIDHIIPVSSATTEEEILKLNHYTNLQPLCSKINRDIKIDKIDWE